MTDLQAKYQKLASEYSKLRAHLPVLKKAVLDEQAKEDSLKEQLNEKDQAVRKYEQEVDSLMFRNQQLLARVTILQAELDDGYSKHKKHKWHTDPAQPPKQAGDTVLGEELQSKIEENARLHTQVYEKDQVYQQTVDELREQLRRLEADASQHQQVLGTAVQKSDADISKLHAEKAMLQVQLQKQETQSREATQVASSSEERLKGVEDKLNAQLEESNRIIRENLKFIDTRNHSWNMLNVPHHDRRRQLQAQELLSQAEVLLAELTAAWTDYYAYSEQRCAAFHGVSDGARPLSDLNSKYCAHLRDCPNYMRPLEQSFRQFTATLQQESVITLDTADGLQHFASHFAKFVQYVSTLLPYQLLSIEEETYESSCTEALAKKNMDFHSSIKRYTSALSTVATYVSSLAAQSGSDSDRLTTSPAKLFELFTKAFAAFHEATKNVSKQFNTKVSLEHRLPTATQKLKVTDECIVSSLVNQVTCTGKLSAFLTGNLEFFCSSTSDCVDNLETPDSKSRSHPIVNSFHQRAASYLNSIQTTCPESVPYSVSLHNRNILFSSTESRDSLAQQVVSLQEQLGKLEQEKEHWLLETELQKMKYEKQAQRVSELEACLRKLNNVDGSIDDNIEPAAADVTDRETKGSTVQTSLLGHLEHTCHTDMTEDNEAREGVIKRHYSDRITALTSQLQLADSKAVHFHAECRALHKHMTLSQKDKEALQETLNTANLTVTQLKDELATTTSSYKGQLSTMSEHLAAMNEKLARQQDEIDMLKYQNSQMNKKGHGK